MQSKIFVDYNGKRKGKKSILGLNIQQGQKRLRLPVLCLLVLHLDKAGSKTT